MTSLLRQEMQENVDIAAGAGKARDGASQFVNYVQFVKLLLCCIFTTLWHSISNPTFSSGHASELCFTSAYFVQMYSFSSSASPQSDDIRAREGVHLVGLLILGRTA